MSSSSHNNAEGPILNTYQAVVSAFSDFLTVAIHTILYERDIYPRESFLKARKYNYPVRQSRHPKVCRWIQDAVNAVEGEMLKVREDSCFRCRFDFFVERAAPVSRGSALLLIIQLPKTIHSNICLSDRRKARDWKE